MKTSGLFSFACSVVLAVVLASNLSGAYAATNLIIINVSAEAPTVGMEGQLDVALPPAGLITKPGDHRAPVIVRIVSSQPYGTLTRYDLRYIGRVPGSHDLRDYLFDAEGQPGTNLPALKVGIAGLLPNPYNGWLEEEARHAPTLFSGYRAMLIAIGLLWVVAFFVIRRLGRTAKPVTAPPTAPHVPTFAEKIRPLVERAARGELSADEKATLERMLITHWQQRLQLADANAGDLIHQLRQHPEAGVLLRALENWLHRPPGRGTVRVDEFLSPYRNLPDETASAIPT